MFPSATRSSSVRNVSCLWPVIKISLSTASFPSKTLCASQVFVGFDKSIRCARWTTIVYDADARARSFLPGFNIYRRNSWLFQFFKESNVVEDRKANLFTWNFDNSSCSIVAATNNQKFFSVSFAISVGDILHKLQTLRVSVIRYLKVFLFIHRRES